MVSRAGAVMRYFKTLLDWLAIVGLCVIFAHLFWA